MPTNLDEEQIQAKLWDMIPYFDGYAISFAVIGIYWISYHKYSIKLLVLIQLWLD
ncbi:MAG: TMEM175 family protein [Nitrososphaeraceae archaeon]